MLHVAQPLALLALGTLAVPILIHLRRRPLPVVRVGSLRPYQALPHSRRSTHLERWPLLLMRCGLLAALTLALAGAHWIPRNPPPVRWALRVPGTPVQDADQLAWRRQLGEGFTPLWLAPGFPGAAEWDAPRTADPRADLWSLLRLADRQVPAGSEAWVFGPTWTAQFQGERPTLRNLRVRWHPVATPPPEVPPTPVVRVGLVHHPNRAEDARFLRAAFQATGVSLVSDETPEWIVQLGSAPLPDRWAEAVTRGTRLIQDAPDALPVEEVTRRLSLRDQVVHLHRRVAPGPGAPLFRDSHGEPWLTEQRDGSSVTWHLAFRLHPEWTDWPLGSAFPEWWRNHLLPEPPDLGLIDPDQAAPRFNPEGSSPAPETVAPGSIDLRAGCWLVGAILFLAERAVASARVTRGRRQAPSPSPAGPPP